LKNGINSGFIFSDREAVIRRLSALLHTDLPSCMELLAGDPPGMIKLLSLGSRRRRSSVNFSSLRVSDFEIRGTLGPLPSSAAESAPATKSILWTSLSEEESSESLASEIAKPRTLFSSSIAPYASTRGESFATLREPYSDVSPLSPFRVYTEFWIYS